MSCIYVAPLCVRYMCLSRCVDLFGWMVLFSVSLDSVSYVELVMAVGLTIGM